MSYNAIYSVNADGTGTAYGSTNVYDDSSVKKTDIADNLITDDATKVLSAKQGKALNDNKLDNSNVLLFTNKTVATSAWVNDSTYAEYPKKAVITCTGVTANHVPTVTFNVTEAEAGIYAPVALSGSGTVTIYASEVPSASITIPSILCVKGA